jgi:hypothetical protein
LVATINRLAWMSCGFEVLDLAALMFMGLDMLILSNWSVAVFPASSFRSLLGNTLI